VIVPSARAFAGQPDHRAACTRICRSAPVRRMAPARFFLESRVCKKRNAGGRRRRVARGAPGFWTTSDRWAVAALSGTNASARGRRTP